MRTLRASSLALALGFAMASPAPADVLPSSIGFNTWGNVDHLGVTPPPVAAASSVGPDAVQFRGVTGGTIAASGDLNLGQFAIAPASPGVATTYHDTPFLIALDAPQFHKTVYDPAPPGTPYTDLKITEYVGGLEVLGHLNGTVGADGHSSVVATFDRVAAAWAGPIATDQRKLVNVFPFPAADIALPPALLLSSDAGGSTPVNARITLGSDPNPVPEPAPIAVLLAGLAGLGLRRPRRSASSRTAPASSAGPLRPDPPTPA